MSPDGVHDYEMPNCPDDQWLADDPLLAAFAEDLRIVADGPAPEPRPGLVAVMRQGPVQLEPATGRKRKMLTKTVLGGLLAKAALGMGVAAASMTAAGAAGVLPEPAQEVVASVVEATTPFSLPSDVTSLATDDVDLPDGSTTTTSTTLAGAGGETDTDEVTGTRTVNHGLCVSTAAKDKTAVTEGNHGKTVSSVARSDCGKTDATGSTTTTVAPTTTTVAGGTPTTLAGDANTANSGSRNSGRGNSGNGNGGNSGNAGGNGNSGRN